MLLDNQLIAYVMLALLVALVVSFLMTPVVKFDSGIVFTVEKETIYLAKEKDAGGRDQILTEIVQVPLRLAYAVTIHKSQGQTFDSVFVDCSRMFLYGQAYVALSRARTLGGLAVRGFNPRSRGAMSDPSITARYMVMEQEAYERAHPDQ